MKYPMNPAELDAASNILHQKINFPVQVGIILGSGLSGFADEVQKPITIPYESIPHFPRSTVPGHSGRFVGGFIHDTSVLLMQGRVHFYEGYSMAEAAMGVRLMASLGVRTLIVTNAAGAVDASFTPGDFMLITDHLNLMGTNPLVGAHHADWGERFVDQSDSYTPHLKDIARRAAKNLGIAIKEGVYAALPGPTYETPAEVRMLRVLGAAAAGMSTVPEVIVARQCGMRVLGISLITNMGAGIAENLNHAEVVEIAHQRKEDFQKFLGSIIQSINEE